MISAGPAVSGRSGRILHVGCGGDSLPPWLNTYDETRLDIDRAWSPDFVACMTDMGDVGVYDAVYSSHSLEHVHGYQVASVLAEFHRVLRPGGHALIFVPDTEDVRPTDEVLFESPSGPIKGLDIFYGKQDLIETMPHMAHHTAFTARTLELAMKQAGFEPVLVQRCKCFNLFGAGVKP